MKIIVDEIVVDDIVVTVAVEDIPGVLKRAD